MKRICLMIVFLTICIFTLALPRGFALVLDLDEEEKTDYVLIQQAVNLRETFLRLNNDVEGLKRIILGFLAIHKIQKEIQKDQNLSEHLRQLVVVFIEDEQEMDNLEVNLKEENYSQMNKDELQKTIAFLKQFLYYRAEFRKSLQNIERLLEKLLIKVFPLTPVKGRNPKVAFYILILNLL